VVVMMVVAGLVVIIGSGGRGHGNGSFVAVVVIVGLDDSCHLRTSRWSRWCW